MNSLWCKRKRKGKESTSSIFTQNERKRAIQTSQEWQRNDKINFPCVKMRKKVTKKGRKHKNRNGESNQHLWNSEKRNEQQKQWEWTEKSITFLLKELQWQIHFQSMIKGHEEQSPPVNLEEGQWFLTWQPNKSDYEEWSCSHLYPHREIPSLRKGRTICLWTLVYVQTGG